METMNVWVRSLDQVNQGFYVGAFFFGVLFLWQVVLTLLGLDSHTGLDTHGGLDAHGGMDSHVEATWQHQTPTDWHDTVVAFKLLSIRSVLAFFTLFTWSGALYLNYHVPLAWAPLYSLLWGLLGMVLVSLVFFLMQRMTETGNMNIATCVGTQGTVYLDIPEGGVGEVRVTCSRIVTHLRARSAVGALKAGEPIRVKRAIGPNTVEVETAPPATQQKESNA